jgi:hypothetical protein
MYLIHSLRLYQATCEQRLPRAAALENRNPSSDSREGARAARQERRVGTGECMSARAVEALLVLATAPRG